MFPFASIPDTLALRAEATPDKEAVCEVHVGNDGTFLNNSLTFSKLHSSSLRLAKVLTEKYRLSRGDRVALLLENTSHYLSLYNACATTGIIAVPLNFNFTCDDIIEVVNDCKAKLLLVQESTSTKINSSEVQQVVDVVDVDDMLQKGATQHIQDEELANSNSQVMETRDNLTEPWVIMYTSGTSGGKKKGVVRSQQSSIAGFWSHMETMAFSRNDRYLAIWDMYGISTFFFSFMVMYLGGTCFLLNADKLKSNIGWVLKDAIDRFKITYTTAGPSYFQAILNDSGPKKSFDHLSKVLLSGAPSTPELKQKMASSWLKTKVFEIYGSTEAGIISVLCPDDPPQEAQCVGIEPAGSRPILIMKEDVSDRLGEVVVNTTMMFSSYWGKPDLTAERLNPNGWFCTGDVGYKRNGYLYLEGRADDRINLPTGIAFYPIQSETVIKANPLVDDAILLVADLTSSGDEVLIALTVANQIENCNIQETISSIRHGLEKKVASAEIPNVYVFVSSTVLPRTSNGKIIRGKTKEVFQSLWHDELIKAPIAGNDAIRKGYYTIQTISEGEEITP